MEREFNNGQLYVKEDISHIESSCFKPNSAAVRGHVSVLVIQMADIMYCNLRKKNSVTLGTKGFFRRARMTYLWPKPRAAREVHMKSPYTPC